MTDSLILTRAESRNSSLDESKRTCEFVASTTTLDSHGSIVNQNWRLDRYRKNPIALRDHWRSNPIGTAEVRVENDQLIAVVEFASGTTVADETWELVKQGVLRAVSVGFRPGSYEFKDLPDGDWIIIYDSPELYELSVVAIPSNEDCLARALAASSTEEQKIRAALAERRQTARAAEETTMADQKPIPNESRPETISKEAHDLLAKSLQQTIADREAVIAERDAEIAKLKQENETLRTAEEKAKGDRVETKVRALVGKKLTAANVEKFIKIAKRSEEDFDEIVKELPDLGFGIGTRVAESDGVAPRAAGETAKEAFIEKRTSERVREFGETRMAAMKIAMQEAESKGL